MDTQISAIKQWLGTGSINIFGLPMSGKDTQGERLATMLGAKLLSSGIIIRAKEAETHQNLTDTGNLIPTDVFYEWILPYFYRTDLASSPLILSSVGRWSSEEDGVLEAAKNSGHELKAVVLLNISEADVEGRWQAAKALGDRGNRKDDKDLTTFRNRLQEFRTKTLPVLQHYKELGLLVEINGDQPRDAVTSEIVAKLSAIASKSLAETRI
ncbi:nucleoside monophosphate kinase [Candidatus Saccharibacteria bacterium]|nr:nucleoside monophosphate kinase [Candidatus Saccharibacteria bacterium]